MNIISTKLSTLLNSFVRQTLLLPEIQRDFVWSKPKVINLVDSLYKGFPIGAMLLWRTNTSNFQKPLKINSPINPLETSELIHGYLLDGQQRLTALLKVLNEDVQIRFHIEKEYFEIESRKNRKDPFFISISEVLNKKIGYDNVLDEIKKNDLNINKNNILANFLKINSLFEKPVALLEYVNDDYANATKLFIRFNSGGVKLKQSELAIAELAKSAPTLVGKEIRNYSEKWQSKNFVFTIPFLTKCLAALKTDSVSFNDPEEIWEGRGNSLKEDWINTSVAIDKTIKFLSGTMHWDSTTWVSSYNALIPIIYMFGKSKSRKQLTESDGRILRKWLAIVIIRRRYSGSSDSTLDSDLRKIKDGYNAQNLWNSLPKNYKKRITISEINEASKSGPLMSIYYSLLKNKDAKDWITGNKIDGNLLGFNSSLEIHHIFPQSILYKDGWTIDLINIFGNYAILQKGSNIEIGNKLPIEYLKRGTQFTNQFIPSDKILWKMENYEKFLKEREKLLQKALNNYLGLKS